MKRKELKIGGGILIGAGFILLALTGNWWYIFTIVFGVALYCNAVALGDKG